MLTKSMIAIAAVLASLSTLPVESAEAHTNVDFNVGVGIGLGGGFYPGYGVYYAPGAYYEAYDGISCGQARSIVKGNGFYKVSAIDCSAPTFKFIAWQGGNKYKVRVNSVGNITGVTPL